MLEIKNISVQFYNKVVLSNVSLTFQEGKIHALCGENGAGKTTLAHVLSGDLIPDSGQIFIDSKEVNFKIPKDAIKYGICCVHQRPLLADSISIKENILLGLKKTSDTQIEQQLENWLPGIKKNTLVKNLTGSERFFVSLCGNLLKNPKYLILDEPTTLLDFQQRKLLFTNLINLSKQGLTVIIISHNLDEVKNYTDTTTILKKGIIAKSFIQSKTLSSTNECQHKNNELKTDINKSKNIIELHFENLTSRPKDRPAVFNASFSAASGEITLIQGMRESGLNTLENAITGMEKSPVHGTVSVHDGEQKIALKENNKNLTSKKLRNSEYSFGIVSSNKTYRCSDPKLTVLQLLTCYHTDYSQKELTAYANLLIQRAEINIKPEDKAKCLSGGMLQRLILARELDRNPKILILCECLQGLDSESTLKFCNKILEHAQKNNIVIILDTFNFPKNYCNKTYTLSNGFCKLNEYTEQENQEKI